MSPRPLQTRTTEPHALTDTKGHPATTGIVALLVLTALFVLTQLYAAIPLIAPVGAELHGDATFALATAFSLCYAAGFLLWGPIADHLGRKKVMVLGLACLTAATLVCALASSITALAISRGAQGLMASSFAPVALAYLAEATPTQRRPIAIGAMSTAFLVAGIAGQVFASAISLVLGWAWVFGLSGIFLAACLLGAIVFVIEPSRPATSGGLGRSFAATAHVATRPAVLLLCAAHVTLLLSFVSMYTGLGPHLTTLGLGSSQVIWLRLVGLPGMFASLLVGPLARRLGMSGVARAGFAFATLGLVAEALLAPTLLGIALASLVFVTGVALTIPAMITLFGETAVPNYAGGMALNGFVLFIGASLGSLAAGLNLAFPTLLVALAGLLALAVVCISLFAKLHAGKQAVQ